MKGLFFIIGFVSAVVLAGKVDQPSAWALLVAGDKGWVSYPVQSSMYKMYQLVHDAGVPDDHIITFFADDIAYNNRNPFFGEVYNEYYDRGGKNVNVYRGIVKDYTGGNATAVNFLRLLEGGSPIGGSGKVLASTMYDNVFIFYAGTGGYSSSYYRTINMVNGVVDNGEIALAIKTMTANMRYKKLMFLMDANYSADMFNTIGDVNTMPNAYFIASNPSGISRNGDGCNYDENIHNFVTRCWSHSVTSSLEQRGLDATIESFYRDIHKDDITVCQLGDANMKSMTIRDFLQNTDSKPFYSKYRTPQNNPGLSFCEFQKCSESGCECYASCMSKGLGESRCSDLCCVGYDCYRS